MWIDLLTLVSSLGILFMSVIFHEVAHGWTALYFGDDTAKRRGRLTLNPKVHLDLFGSILLPFLLALLRQPLLGWAKPVPVNFSYLRDPRVHMIWVALAGPCTNVLIAVLLSFIARLNLAEGSYLSMVTNYGIVINLVLAVFNMVPIPPLDGSRVVMGLLPRTAAYYYQRIEPYGIAIVFFALWLGLFQKGVYPAALLLAKLIGL
ncbi:MAG: site-2 protease family protein [Candidatus Omnitrophica bacterium]|nr:site-2 protease family protein [Candidatus Omnitrophota bacterium]